MTRIVIAGGGLAGCLCALAMKRRRPEVPILLVEAQERLGGKHIWSFFDSDIADDHSWVLEGIERSHWARHCVRFPLRQRKIDVGYNSICSTALEKAVRATLQDDEIRLGQRIASVGARSVSLRNGELINCDAAIDARGSAQMVGLNLGWQKFVGRTYRFHRKHGIEVPVIMDATVDQLDGYRFIYQLPFSAHELLIEDTYYSLSPLLDEEAVRSRLDAAAGTIGKASLIDEEQGVLPVVMDGSIDGFWNGEAVPRIGLRGGFFHPTTSYSLPDAVATAALVATQEDLHADALYRSLRRRATQLWRQRGFYRLLNRMLFRAAEPEQSYRVLEHFYRLPRPVIARFYAGQSTAMDKIRILSGRPPVSIGRALGALRSRAA